MTSLVLRQAMQQHLLLTIIIIQGIFLIDNTCTHPIIGIREYKTDSNPATEISKPEMIQDPFKRSHLKNILRHLFRDDKEDKIKQTVGGLSLKIKSDKFHQLMEETKLGSTETNVSNNDGEDDVIESEDLLQNMKTKWFNRIN